MKFSEVMVAIRLTLSELTLRLRSSSDLVQVGVQYC